MPLKEHVVTSGARKDRIQALIEGLDSLDRLKELFWSELSFEKSSKTISMDTWPESNSSLLAGDPLLIACAGKDGGFSVIYSQLAADSLRLGAERIAINQLRKKFPHALYVFSDRNQKHWHFVKSRLGADDESGISSKIVLRRFAAGPGERIRTAAERFAEFVALDSQYASGSALQIQERIDSAFDVEAVQKEFFKKFGELYHLVADDVRKTPGINSEEVPRLAQLILDRLLFLYFIQKKGWLDRNPDYLYSRFREQFEDKPDDIGYFSTVLAPLFRALSNGDKDEKVGIVPHLNGGLFEDSDQLGAPEDMKRWRLRIRNSTFKAIFDDLLERFNFTVTEDTPLDVEVAIDPEMLGKIFESLILKLEKNPEDDLRKLTGSYYTPRPVVHFMCRQALQEYLAGELAGGAEKISAELRERIEWFLDLPPADHLDEAGLELLSKRIPMSEAKTLRQALLDCKICDPAVGSGAFPVGMLHEITAALARLDLLITGQKVFGQRNYDYDLKKQVIENCLYGVDIQEQAVKLCELRLWLSLVVDYQVDWDKGPDKAIRDVPSLPNLSYQIIQGDSLVERMFGAVIPATQVANDPRSKQLIDRILDHKNTYFEEPDIRKKRKLEFDILLLQAELLEQMADIQKKQAERTAVTPDLFGGGSERNRKAEAEQAEKVDEWKRLKARIHKAREAIKADRESPKAAATGDIHKLRRKYFGSPGNTQPTFIWKLDFAEVFARKGGFDIMIANPPYVRADNPSQQGVREDIRNSGYYESLWEKWDLYVPFIERAYKMLRPGGVLEFITSDAYCHAKYAQKSQEWFLRNSIISRIDFVSDLKIFEAGVRNIIFQYKQGTGGHNQPLRILHKEEFGCTEAQKTDNQSALTHLTFKPDTESPTQNLSVPCNPVADIFYVSKGAVVHAEEKEHHGEFKLEDLVQDSKDAKHPKEFVEGKDVDRWAVTNMRYIEWGTRRAPSRFSRPTFPELYDVPEKVISVDMSAGTAKLKVAYDNAQLFHNHSAWCFVPWHYLKGVKNRSIAKSARYADEADGDNKIRSREALEELSRSFDIKYVLAVMNSSWAHEFLRHHRRSNIHLYPDDWKKLPIPVATQAVQKKIASKVGEILKRLKINQPIDDLEAEVDAIVTGLYEGKEV